MGLVVAAALPLRLGARFLRRGSRVCLWPNLSFCVRGLWRRCLLCARRVLIVLPFSVDNMHVAPFTFHGVQHQCRVLYVICPVDAALSQSKIFPPLTLH